MADHLRNLTPKWYGSQTGLRLPAKEKQARFPAQMPTYSPVPPSREQDYFPDHVPDSVVQPEYFVLFDWDACLIDGVNYETPDQITLDGTQYTSPDWDAGDYCDVGDGMEGCTSPPFPFPNPGGAVDGLTVWQVQTGGGYICVAATGWYGTHNPDGSDGTYIGTTGPLLPPNIGCSENNDPIPTDACECDCCAGGDSGGFNTPGVTYASTYSIP